MRRGPIRCALAAVTLVTVSAVLFADDPDFAASKVTVDVRDTPLRDVMRMFDAQTGNRSPSFTDDLGDRRVTLALTDVPYWKAMMTLCRQEGLLFHFTRLSEAQVSRDCLTCAGPLVVRVRSYESRRRFRNFMPSTRLPSSQRGKTTADPDPDTYLAAFTFESYCENRLKVIWSKGTVTKVLTPDGKPLPLPEPHGRYLGGRDLRRSLARSNVNPRTWFWLQLPETPKDVDRLAEIHGNVQIEYGVGKKQLIIEDVLSAGKKPVTVGTLTLTMTKAQRTGDWLRISLEAQTDEALIVQEEGKRYGFVLIDPDGTRYDYAFFSRSRLLTGKKVNVGRPPRARTVLKDTGTSKGTLTVSFRRTARIDGKWSLVYTFPEKRVLKTVPFVIKDVPIP